MELLSSGDTQGFIFCITSICYKSSCLTYKNPSSESQLYGSSPALQLILTSPCESITCPPALVRQPVKNRTPLVFLWRGTKKPSCPAEQTMPGHVRLVSGSPSKATHTKPGLQEPPSPGGHKEEQECAERVVAMWLV